jgi:carboxypeptidase Q
MLDTANMRTSACLLLAAAIALPPGIHAEPVDLEMVTRIRHEGLHRSQVMDTLHGLTEGFGGRVTGSPALRDASAWTESRFREWGLQQVRQEPFEFGEGWTFSAVEVRALAPFEAPLRAIPLAWTDGTDGPVRGAAVKAKLSSESDFDALRGKLRDRIVFLEALPPRPGSLAGVPPPGDPAEERPFRRHDEQTLRDIGVFQIPRDGVEAEQAEFFRSRRALIEARNRFLREEGALATVEGSIRKHGIVWATGGGSGGWTHRSRGVPGLVMSDEHYQRVLRALDDGHQVELEIRIDSRFHDDAGPVANVLAEIPGSDRRAAIVMAGAHIDSWHAGTGATDNGAGVAVVMEAARILRALGVQPRRTIRFALWAGEEQGLLGSRSYVRNHVATRPPPTDPDLLAFPPMLWGPTWPITPLPGHAGHSVYFNLDNGAGRIRGIYAQGNAAAVPIFRAWLEPFADLGATLVTMRDTGSTDHIAFDDVGVPGFQFVQDGLAYMTRTWHTDLDTIDHVQRDDLMQSATIMASFLYHAAMRAEPFPRKPMPQPAPDRPQRGSATSMEVPAEATEAVEDDELPPDIHQGHNHDH